MTIYFTWHSASHSLVAEVSMAKNKWNTPSSFVSNGKNHTVYEARMNMSFEKSQNLEVIPPTKKCPFAKWAIYQCGVWSRALEPQQNLPSPSNFGWREDTQSSASSSTNSKMWVPIWFTNGEASKELRELLKCTCTTDCRLCKCTNASLLCTMLCKCKCPNKYAFGPSQ